MKMRDVCDLLTSLHVKWTTGPHGVTFTWYFDSGNSNRTGTVTYRVESGSGVACRGDAWNVVELPEGKSLGMKTRRMAKLRRQILAALAEGQRPPDRHGYETYARWHTYGLTSSVQWFQRRKRGVGVTTGQACVELDPTDVQPEDRS